MPAPPTGVASALLVARVGGGLALGSRVADRLPSWALRRAILTLSFAGGLVAVGRGLFGA